MTGSMEEDRMGETTPRPWRIYTDNLGFAFVGTPSHDLRHKSEWMVAEVHGHHPNPHTEEGKAQYRANAELIVAAVNVVPDLLDVLGALTERLGHFSDTGQQFDNLDMALVDRARTVMTQAKDKLSM